MHKLTALLALIAWNQNTLCAAVVLLGRKEMSNSSIVVTGFGVFADVHDNPSKRIVEELSSTAFRTDIANTSFSFEILEVSVDFCSKFHDSCESDNQNYACKRPVYVHIGVDSKGTHIKLEQCAYNNMNFRVPDVRGYQPESAQISDSCALDAPLYSALPLAAICEELNSTYNDLYVPVDTEAAAPDDQQEQKDANHKLVRLSEDPGRYLCNYVYYQALQRNVTAGEPLNALFVHVPPFSAVSQETQTLVIKKLLSIIATQLAASI